jgi:hypothetical protein
MQDKSVTASPDLPWLARRLLSLRRMARNSRRRPPISWRRDLGVVVLSLLLGLSCDPFGTEHTFEDEGRVCLYPGGSTAANPFGLQRDPLPYQANQALDLVITMPDCLSSSCSHDERATCSAAVEGTTIRVQSAASYRQQGTTCTDDCGALAARCSTAPLPAGTYDIRHGDTTLTITIPSTVPPPCAGKGLGGP